MISKKYIDILGFRIPKLVFLIMGYVFTLYGLFTGQHKPFYWASPFYCGLGIIAMYYLFDFIEDPKIAHKQIEGKQTNGAVMVTNAVATKKFSSLGKKAVAAVKATTHAFGLIN